jgi:hypothetical protein
MCYRSQCLLHQIYANRVKNINVHQGPKIIYDDKDIHLLSDVVKVGTSF